MADNTVLDPGTGGDTIATDDIGGIKHQRIKVQYGVDGSATDVSDTNPLPVDDAGGSLTVDDGGSSLTVDGTVTANAGTGTFTVDQADTATADYDSGAGTVNQTMLGLALPASGGPVAGGTSTAPVRTDPTGTTAQPVTDNGGSLTVDGTVTANAGTGDFSVVGKAADGAAVAGNPVLVAGQDGTNAQSLSTNASGHVNIADGGNSITVDGSVSLAAAVPAGTNNIGDVDVLTLPAIPAGSNKIGGVDLDSDAATGAAVPATAQFVAGTDGTNARALKTDASGELQVDVLTMPTVTVTGTVTADTEMAAAAAAADNAANPTAPIVQAFLSCFDGSTWDRAPGDSTNGIDVDVTRLPSGTVAGSSSLPAGTNNIGDVDVLTLPALPTGTNTIGNVGLASRTSGGLSIFRTLDADETEEDVKTSAGQLYGYYIYNDGAAEVYVKFYNATAANVTVGSTTPVLTIPVPAGSAANCSFEHGIAFGTAITIAATTGVADADTAAPAANQVVANVFYA